MSDWDWQEWTFFGLVASVVVVFACAIGSAVKADNDYANACHARGGEVIIGASPKLCRDGDKLINVYKGVQNGSVSE